MAGKGAIYAGKERIKKQAYKVTADDTTAAGEIYRILSVRKAEWSISKWSTGYSIKGLCNCSFAKRCCTVSVREEDYHSEP